MNEFIFGFSTGLSLILAIGAQNLFVIEQGIKKTYDWINHQMGNIPVVIQPEEKEKITFVSRFMNWMNQEINYIHYQKMLYRVWLIVNHLEDSP